MLVEAAMLLAKPIQLQKEKKDLFVLSLILAAAEANNRKQ
jgi:hypothetical protein